jgi:hypothetical protein
MVSSGHSMFASPAPLSGPCEAHCPFRPLSPLALGFSALPVLRWPVQQPGDWPLNLQPSFRFRTSVIPGALFPSSSLRYHLAYSIPNVRHRCCRDWRLSPRIRASPVRSPSTLASPPFERERSDARVAAFGIPGWLPPVALRPLTNTNQAFAR